MKRLFTHTHIVALLLAATMTQATNAEGLGVPYLNTFDNEEAFGEMTVINANGDYNTWQYSTYWGTEHTAVIGYNETLDMDDWLLTPLLRLEAGKTYQMSFTTFCSMPNYPERIEAWLGTGLEAPADMTDRIVEPTVVDWSDGATLSAMVTISETGDYCLAIHGISTAYAGELYVDDISVSEFNESVPAAVEDLTVTSANGRAPVTLTFSTPSLTVGGSILDALAQIIIRRDGSQIAAIDSPTPGSPYTYTDNDVADGTHTYQVMAVNDSGPGKVVSASIFIGPDTEPMAPQNLRVTDLGEGRVRIEWDAPGEIGANGGYIDPETVRYNVISSKWGYTQLASDISECYVEDEISIDEGQQSRTYTVQAYTTDPWNYSSAQVTAIVGPPYELPFAESGAYGEASTLWSLVESNDNYLMFTWSYASEWTWVQAQDDGNGYLKFMPEQAGDCGMLASGKISLAGALNPQLSFYYYADPASTNTIDAIIIGAEGQQSLVWQQSDASSAEDEGWQQVTVDLTAFAGETVQIGFRITSQTGYDNSYIDNITIANDDSAGVSRIDGDRRMTVMGTYDLQGRRTSHPSRGIVIEEGKKILIK